MRWEVSDSSVDEYKMEGVETFKYPGLIIISKNDVCDIEERLPSANKF